MTTLRALALQASCWCAVLGASSPARTSALAADPFEADDAFCAAHLDGQIEDSLLAHLSVQEQSLVQEYAKAWPRLGLFYNKLKASGRFRSEHRIPGDDHLTPSEAFEGAVKLAGFNHFRVEGRTPGGEQGLIFITPKEIYAFGRNAETGKHFLAAKMGRESRYAQPYNFRFRFHKDPYMCGELTSLMKGVNPGDEIAAIKIDRVVSTRQGDDEIVTITVVCSGRKWCRVIAHEFFRNRAWARRDCQHVLAELEKKNYVIQRIHCNYDGTQDGFPLLKESVHESATAEFSSDTDIDRCRFVKYDQDVVVSREKMTFDSIEHIKLEHSDFDPAPYIAEMGGVGKDSTTPTGSARFPFVLGVNIAVLLLTIVWTWRRRSSQTASNSRAE